MLIASAYALECSYGVEKVKIGLSQPFFLLPPLCDYIDPYFNCSSNLPEGIVFNSTNGGFHGVTNQNGTTWQITVEVAYLTQRSTISLTFEVAQFEENQKGITVLYAESPSNREMDPFFFDKIYSGELSYVAYQSNQINMDCTNEEYTSCPSALDMDITNMWNYWYSSFNSKDQESWTFTMEVDDEYNFYVDDKQSAAGKNEFTQVLSSGLHYLQLQAINYAATAKSYVSYKNTEVTTAAVVSSEYFSSIPPINQYLNWRTSDLILVKNHFQTLTAYYTGYLSWTADSLPEGMTIKQYGRITGTPTKVTAIQPYVISGRSYDNVYYNTTIYMTVLDDIKDNMIQGLDGLYYASAERDCEYREIDRTIDYLKFRRIDKSVNHLNDEVGQWDGLTSTFVSSFTVDWTGLLNIEVPGDYIFFITANGGVRFEIDGHVVVTSTSCSKSTSQGRYKLKVGLVNIKLYYWKPAGDLTKSLKLEWYHLAFGKQTIPDSVFYHIPRYPVSYDYETSTYIKGTPITKNCPTFTTVSKNDFTNFKIYPNLPAGLKMDSSTLCIEGTITETKESLKDTYYSLTAEPNFVTETSHFLTTRFTLSYESYLTPVSITYQPINGKIGERVSSVPVIIGFDYLVETRSDLPKGLNLNSQTGEISGYPSEAVSNMEVNIIVRNAAGQISATIIITIADCSVGEYFFRLKYITGSGTGLTVSVMSNGNSYYLQEDHEADKFYSSYQCVAASKITVKFSQVSGRAGTYSIYQKSNYLLAFGEYRIGKPTTLEIDLENIVGKPEIKYDPLSYTFITGESVSFYPQILKYAVTGFSLSEESILPSGLYFNTSNGLIFGEVDAQASESGSFKIMALNDQLQSDVVTISYTQASVCENSQVMVTISVEGGISGPKMVLVASDMNGNVITKLSGLKASKTTKYKKCLTEGSYNFQYGSLDGSSWDSTSYVDLYNGDTLVTTLNFQGGSTTSNYKFLLVEPIPTNGQWSYSSTYQQDWKTVSTVSWEKAEGGTFPRPNDITTMYYRYSFNVIDPSAYGRYEVILDSDTGFVLYANGREIVRDRMPEGEITQDTKSNSEKSMKTFTVISLPASDFISGENIIAVESHKGESGEYEEVDPFKVSLSIYNYDSACTNVVGKSTGNNPSVVAVSSTVNTDLTCNECAQQLFDVDASTKMCITGVYLSSRPVEVVSKLVNRYVAFNGYVFVTANDSPERDPKKWELYGTTYFNDGDTVWELIDSKSDQALTDLRYTKQSFMVDNPTTKLYNGFKIKFQDTRSWSTIIQLADYYPSMCGGNMCLAENQYPATQTGLTARIPCADGSSNYRTRLCKGDSTWDYENVTECVGIEGSFSYPTVEPLMMYDLIDPIKPTLNGLVVNIRASKETPLPSSLTIDTVTGEISGIAREKITPAKNYTIIADTPSGEIKTDILLEIKSASCGDSGIYPNEFQTDRCSADQSGYRTRECLATSPPTWSKWDESKCTQGRSPRCNLTNTDYVFTFKQPITPIKPDCLYPYKSISFDKNLPTGLSVNDNGEIVGTPLSPMRKSQYVMKIITEEGGYDEITLFISVYGILKSCKLPYTSIKISINAPVTFASVVCDEMVDEYTADNLPTGFTIDTSTSVISGIATEEGEFKANITAINILGSYSLIVTIETVNMNSNGVYIRSPTERVYNYNVDNVVRKIVSDETDYESVVTNHDFTSISSNPPITIAGITRTDNFMYLFSGKIKIEEGGTYEFQVSSSYSWLYIDNMGNNLCNMYSSCTYTTTFEAGSIHEIGFVLYQGYTSSTTIIRGEYKWKYGDMSNFEYFPYQKLFNTPTFIKNFYYPSNDLILYVNQDIGSISPIIEGTFANITGPLSLPTGLSFVDGVITGTPTVEVKRTGYTIKCNSDTSVIEVKIYIAVISITTENMKHGLIGKYYTSSNTINCNYNNDPENDNKFTLGYERIIPTYYHAPSVELWEGLSTAFSSQFSAKWTGYLNVPETGIYDFVITAEDGVGLMIGSLDIRTTACGSSTVDGSTTLTKGLQEIKIIYWKTTIGVIKAVSVKWSKTTGINTISLQELSENLLYYKPTSSLSYTYPTAVYIVNKEITKNEPIYYTIDASNYKSFYCSPALPNGLFLDASNGEITGTPIQETGLTTYTITVIGTENDELSFTIRIGVDPYSPPRNLHYEDVNVLLNEEVNIKPTIEGDHLAFYTNSILPKGLRLEGSTGIIRGTALSPFDGEVTIYCANPSATVEATFKIKVNGCESLKTYIELEYSIGNKEVGFKLINKDGETEVEQPIGSITPYSSSVIKLCMTKGSTTFVLNSTAKLGGSYKIYNNGNLIRSGEYKDGLDNVEFIFDSSIVSPKIVKYESIDNVYYSNIEYKFHPVIDGGVISFLIDADWPVGFSLDKDTGIITGKLSGVDSATFSVYGISIAGTRSNTFSFTIKRTECLENMIGASISAVEDGNNMIVELLLDDVTIFSYYGFPNTYTRTFTYCISAKKVEMKYGSIDSKAWNSNSVVSPLIANSKMSNLNHKEDGDIETYTIELSLFLDGKSTWQVTSTEPASSWIGEYITPTPNGWKEYILSSLPTREKITTYYRTKFTFADDISNITSLKLYVTFDAGIILYLNGVEFYRRNLPLTGAYNDLPATAVYDPAVSKSVTIGPHLILQGDNILAVEVHKHDRSAYADPLSIILMPILNEEEEKCQIKTLSSKDSPTMTATLSGATPESSDPFVNGYDYDNTTKFVTKQLSTVVNVNVDFYWPDNTVEYVNEFIYISGNDAEQRDPTDIEIYGTYNSDKPEWILLGKYGPVENNRSYTTIFNIDNIDRSYEGYRFHVGAVRDTSSGWGHSLHITEFLGLHCKPVYCPSETQSGIMWKSTIAGNKAYTSCEVNQYGFKERLCRNDNGTGVFEDMIDYCDKKPTKIEYPEVIFYINHYANYTPTADGGVDKYTIDCKLPHGVLFDTRYGIIKGTPDVTDDAKDTKCKVYGIYGDNYIVSNVTITTRYIQCIDENGVWPDTEGGEYGKAACAYGYEGLRTIYCDNSDPVNPVFKNENTTDCVLLKPTIKYSFESPLTLHFTDSVEFDATIFGVDYTVTSDSLPADLKVDPKTGDISGIVNESTDANGKKVTVTITNDAGSTDTEFTLIIKDYPGEITYSFSKWVFYVGFYNETTGVSINGTNVKLLRMNPELPKSLNVNLENGKISGIVDEGVKESNSAYQLVAENGEGEIQSNPVTIQVIQPKCPQNGTWKETNAGETAIGSCPIHYTGNATRYCTKEINPVWEEPIVDCVKKELYCEDENAVWPKTEGGFNATISCGKGYIGNRTRECVLKDNDETYFGNEDISGCTEVHPSIKYISEEMVIALDEECAENIPVLTDLMVGSYVQISPAIPAGMNFDNVTGKISGTPSRSQIRSPYTIVGTGLDGAMYYTTVYIQITSDYADMILYTRPDMIFFIGLNDLSQEVPKKNGIIRKWYVVPELPKDLQIGSDGKIYGTVANGVPLLTTSHTVYAEVELSNLTSSITITVKESICEGEVYNGITWPTTKGNETATGECPINYEGSPKRFCPISTDGSWSNIIEGECVSKAPSFEYPSTNYNWILNSNTTNVEPINVVNSPRTYILNCDNSILLYGINFDITTGIFSGSPNDIFTATCTVYATNDFGSSAEVTVIIKVTKPQCPYENGWKETDVNSYAILPCDTDYGVMYRQCLEYNSTSGIWSNEIDKSQCVDKPVDPENDFVKYVSLTLIINDVTNSVDDNAELEIKEAVSNMLNIGVSNIFIKILSRRRFMRVLQSSTKIQVFIQTDEPEKLSSVLESEVIQKEIINYLKQSTKTDIFRNSEITMEVKAVNHEDKKSKSNTGAIVGGVIGGIIVIILIVLVVYYFVRTSSTGRLRVKSRAKSINEPVNRRRTASIVKAEDDGNEKQKMVVRL